MKNTALLLLLTAFGVSAAVPTIKPLPERVTAAVPDRQEAQVPDHVQLTGLVGARIAGNESNRLVRIDPARLLEGYRKRPGRQAWDGEHVGKWLHAATLAWANTGDPALRERLDFVVAELVRCQLEDGYLGTYLEKDRWTEWDVWAHKYNLIGLLTYMRYTGNEAPLPCCRRMGDLLCRTFGEAPGQRDIIKAGHHVGMAPTSVLEPMVLLYRFTGDVRYLDFCKYLLRSWEQPNGPRIVSTLLTVKRVDKVGNGKAYEMLSCLNGLLEYYRTVGGDPQLLEACLNAWQDIVAKRLYLTGASSYGELFHDDYDLPNVANVGETCVTTTWIQFNAQLLRLTGEARFAEQLERVVLNQLLGAQRPDCAAWGYYVQMEGRKPYSDSLDGHCCLSSGPRGVALIPTFAATTDADGVVVNLYDASTARLGLRSGHTVNLAIETRFPAEERVRIRVQPDAPQSFAVKLRLPGWSRGSTLHLNGQPVEIQTGADGYAVIQRAWKPGDEIELRLTLEPRVILGDHANAGKVALLHGPLVLAADEALLSSTVKTLSGVVVANPDLAALAIKPEAAPAAAKHWPDARVFRMQTLSRQGAPASLPLVPFADAGGTGSRYKVWLPLRREGTGNLLLDGEESRSRAGNVAGSIVDDDPQSFVVTFNNQPAAEDWFAVSLPEPAVIHSVAFLHGNNFHDGGWFDAGNGKPKVQVQRTAGGDWETIGELRDYPAATATSPAGLKPGQKLSLRLAAPMKVAAVRVVGVPASGDNPKQAFASCAELQAVGE
jgi:DUF1680 family protein